MFGLLLELKDSLSNNVRKPFGVKMMTLSYDIVWGIHNLDKSKDLEQAIEDIQQKVQELIFVLKLLKDNKQLPMRSFVTCNEQMIALSNRLESLNQQVK